MHKVWQKGCQLLKNSVPIKAKIQLVWSITTQNRLEYWYSAVSLLQLKTKPQQLHSGLKMVADV